MRVPLGLCLQFNDCILGKILMNDEIYFLCALTVVIESTYTDKCGNHTACCSSYQASSFPFCRIEMSHDLVPPREVLPVLGGFVNSRSHQM